MKTALVILCKNQGKYASKIAGAVSAQSVMPDRVLVVMDRPDILEKNEVNGAYKDVPGCDILVVGSAPDRIARPQMVPGVPPFCAGHCRNLAIEMLYGYELIIFTDGDCIPEKQMVESHIAAYTEGGVTVGRRLEGKWLFRDQREVYDKRPIPIFFQESRRVTEEKYVADSGVVWTCNFGMSSGAVDTIKKLNAELYGVSAVFHPDFCGRWGGEDGFLGMECLYAGVPIMTTPKMEHDGVSHIDHPRPTNKYDHVTFLPFLEAKRQELVELMNATGRDVGEFRPLSSLVGKRE